MYNYKFLLLFIIILFGKYFSLIVNLELRRPRDVLHGCDQQERQGRGAACV